MQTIYTKEGGFPISDEAANILIRQGLLDVCQEGDEPHLHLSPARWNPHSVGTLMLGMGQASTEIIESMARDTLKTNATKAEAADNDDDEVIDRTHHQLLTEAAFDRLNAKATSVNFPPAFSENLLLIEVIDTALAVALQAVALKPATTINNHAAPKRESVLSPTTGEPVVSADAVRREISTMMAAAAAEPSRQLALTVLLGDLRQLLARI